MMVIHHPRMPFLFGGIFTEYPLLNAPLLTLSTFSSGSYPGMNTYRGLYSTNASIAS